MLGDAVAEPVRDWTGEEVEAWTRDDVVEVVVYVESVDRMAGWRVGFAHIAGCDLVVWFEVVPRASRSKGCD